MMKTDTDCRWTWHWSVVLRKKGYKTKLQTSVECLLFTASLAKRKLYTSNNVALETLLKVKDWILRMEYF